MSVSLNKSTDKDMSLLTFKAHRSKIQMERTFILITPKSS